VISEGPALIEALPGELQNALNSALRPDEELLIAVRGNIREAFAATAGRLLLLREPAISGAGPVEIREVPVRSISNIRAEPRPVGGRLMWETAEAGAPASTDYPTYDGSKYALVAKRLQEMIGQPRNPSTPSTGPTAPPEPGAALAGRACPKCQTGIPAAASWCPKCGLQASDPCWQCGKALAEGANFCAYCGTPNTEPAVVQCPQCRAVVGPQQGYCAACGTQARIVCGECERPMRRDWAHCPVCAGEPLWEAAGVGADIARLRGDEPEDPSAWLDTTPQADDAADFNARGVQEYEAGNIREAVRLFRQAVEADPTNASYFTNLGVGYGELGDEPQATSAYQRAIDLNPREVTAYLSLGYLYMERERPTEAREMWEHVVRLAPDGEEAREARDNLRSLEDV
jgi:RNA polymerase subunit RPABC4/transcription elongation factor Spt4